MRDLSIIMIQVELLLCCLLLHPMDAISYRKQANVSRHLPLSLGSPPPSSDPLFCQTMLPKSLPGFTYMAPLPKYLVGLALRNALEEAGCLADVQTLELQLYRWGSVNATRVLIHHLQGLQKGRSTQRRVSVEALASALQLSASEHPGSKRVRRSLPTKNCENEQEQSVHNILGLLPGVITYYNLGTALYYAAQNCPDKAKERGQEGAIDLGYDLLMAIGGLPRGPARLLMHTALRPALKARVLKFIQFYQKKEVNIPQQETSMEGLVGTSVMSDLEETTTMTPVVSEEVKSAPYWGWTSFKSYFL